MDIQQTIKAIPLTSGVYFMKNDKDKIIYIGKAVSLRKRVQSYFRKSRGGISKIDLLVSEIHDIDYIETTSEAEALILEASLIKQYNPKFNVDLRDDKSYPFIEVTREDFPRISVIRPRKRKPGAKYYGPYVKVTLVREALKILRKIFYFRTEEKLSERIKLDFQMGLASAPSVDRMNKKEYARNINNVCLILEGKKDTLYKKLEKEMESMARAQRFEQAAVIRDQIQAIGALYSGTKEINYYKEAEQLQRAFQLPRVPIRIETFDISNIMGQQAVGSMVSFLNGKPDKQNYRRFRIKEVEGIDDFKMIGEVVKRRYRRLRNEGKSFPDLIVIDGGKGQLSSACHEMERLDVHIPIISLAKRLEEIFMPNRRNSVRLSSNSLGLKLLQRVRDEAHRFAISYHRKLRSKEVFNKRK